MSASALRLGSLKSWQLKHWAFLTGQPVSGTKPILQANALRHIELLRNEIPKSKRIVSVDMGIRNLAFCAVDTPDPDTSSSNRVFKVGTWKRMDLTLADHLAATEDEHAESSLLQDTDVASAADDAASGTASFTPAAMAKKAVRLAQDFSSYKPDTVLIERQRFRTGRGSAIQEWTIRVNMLEAMLWACFEALRTSHPNPSTPHPVINAISPARVAHFWVAASRISLDPPADLFSPDSRAERTAYNISGGRKKVDKQDKINIVRSWLAGESDIKLAFTEEASNTAAAFERTPNSAGKLDDLADCLLQAIAWAKWQENQRLLKRLWDEAVVELEAPVERA